MDQSGAEARRGSQPLTPEEAEKASAEGRPEPNPDAPPQNGDVKTLRWLLKIEKRRLKEAIRIEKERRVVFPETSVILRDVCRLVDAIAIREGLLPTRAGGGNEMGALEGTVKDLERPRDEFDDFMSRLS